MSIVYGRPDVSLGNGDVIRYRRSKRAQKKGQMAEAERAMLSSKEQAKLKRAA